MYGFVQFLEFSISYSITFHRARFAFCIRLAIFAFSAGVDILFYDFLLRCVHLPRLFVTS